MRLLHTSDWHLGQNFYSKSRAAEHDAFLTWLLDRAQEHEVDAIIVAGDIFDTGSPPSYARELYNRFVVQLQQTGAARRFTYTAPAMSVNILTLKKA